MPSWTTAIASLSARCRVAMSSFAIRAPAGPGESVPEDWNAIPGARGCTPESCAFRDLYQEFQALGVGVFGLSTQTGEEQAEAKRRLHLPYPCLLYTSPSPRDGLLSRMPSSA